MNPNTKTKDKDTPNFCSYRTNTKFVRAEENHTIKISIKQSNS